MTVQRPLQQKSLGSIIGLLAAMLLVVLSVGFNVNPMRQPQRVSDLVARIEALELENAHQQKTLDAIDMRVDALENLGNRTSPILLDEDVIIPRGWQQGDSSDGVLRYWHDPHWELASDEPGAIDLWLDEDTAIFLTWDWSADLLNDLHNDKEFLRFFEQDLLRSDAEIQMDVAKSDALTFMGEDAHYWEVRVASADGYASRMLTVFYPCSDRTSCNIVFVRFDPDPKDTEPVAAFNLENWNFIHTFAHGIKFLTVGKATVRANANLRACPAVDCEITGRLVRGEIIELTAISADGLWYQLESGDWIASGLIFGAPTDLPVVGDREKI